LARCKDWLAIAWIIASVFLTRCFRLLDKQVLHFLGLPLVGDGEPL
jgi:hypothetical protein